MVIRPKIFEQFPEIVAGQSTKLGGVSPHPFVMNLSSHVGDSQENVDENRKRLLDFLAIPKEACFVYQNQIHSANVNIVTGNEGIVKNSDALITRHTNVFLGVTVADCTPLLLYDPRSKIIAAVHAGWRGTLQTIVRATIHKMKELGSDPKNIFTFIGASASKDKYEVGSEVAALFEKQYLQELLNQKFLLDVKGCNYDQLISMGVPAVQIEVNPRCTISDLDLHSYRRDGKRSGRMLALIGRK